MVGKSKSMAASSREKLASLVNASKLAIDIPSKLESLRQLRHELPQEDPVLLTEFLPSLFHFHSDRFSPVRKFVTEMLGEIGLKNTEFLSDIVPVLINGLDDDTPAVVRQAILCGIDLFRSTLEKITVQGLYSSDLDGALESAWAWMLKFKDKVYEIAFEHGSGGAKLLALKFVEVVIRLYTHDSNGRPVEFNISWVKRGHPVLNYVDLSIEASHRLGLLLDQLRFPTVKSLSNSVIIVLIKSLSGIAIDRPAFYSRILPVLLSLEPSSSVVNGVCVTAAHLALKNAFLACSKCTHPSAAPWRDRLAGALKEMQSEGKADRVFHLISAKRENDEPVIMILNLKLFCVLHSYLSSEHVSTEVVYRLDVILAEEEPAVNSRDSVNSNLARKRSGSQTGSDLAEGVPGKRVRTTIVALEGPKKELDDCTTANSQDETPSTVPTSSKEDVDNGPVQQLVATFGALIAQGEKAVVHLEILISSISADLLAEVVMANMRNLPPNYPNAEENDEQLQDISMIGSDDKAKYPPSFVAGVMSLSKSSFEKSQGEEEISAAAPNSDAVHSGMNLVSENIPSPTDFPSSDASIPGVENDCTTMPTDIHDVGNSESGIPGLESFGHNDALSQSLAPSLLASSEMHLEDSSQEQDTSLDQSPKAAVKDVNSLVSSTATSVVLPTRLVLPKMIAPVVDLADEQKDHLQKSCFMRIIDTYKQITVAGGSKIRFSILTYLGVYFPLELDPWKLLQKHILIDYTSNESAVHHLEEVRMKAIRLVANKLYPLSSISQQIEDFAKERLFSAMSGDASDAMNAEGSIADSQKGPESEKPNEQSSLSGSTKDVSSDNHQSCTSESVSPDSVSEAQRCMSLYFALCTKKHSLFRQIFVIYRSTSKAVKQAVHRQIPILVRTMGSSSDLLEIISDPPNGSENLLMQVLHTLTDGTTPSKDLICTVKKLYESKLKDAEVLIPILPFLTNDEVMPIFPHIVNLPLEKFQAALGRILQGSSQSSPVLTPAEILIAIHGIDPERDGIPLKKVTDACNACFELPQTFTQEVIARVLNQLVEQIPPPLLFMRTVLQAIVAFPTLVDFIMGILSRLVMKQIWKYPKLWVGFLKCVQLTKPQSFDILLQLPPAQLENALNRIAALKPPLIAHASQPDIQSKLPRAVLVVLGIASDSQVSSQAQTTQTQTSQTQTTPTQTTQTQTTETETSNSEKDTMTEKSKESSTAS
uniref:Symplekin n=1 Tax=Cajanus cajan TaxID=3821 RepID=A0A151RQJ7_CAJCA|nr:Symplekin [Cajanus cajan]